MNGTTFESTKAFVLVIVSISINLPIKPAFGKSILKKLFSLNCSLQVSYKLIIHTLLLCCTPIFKLVIGISNISLSDSSKFLNVKINLSDLIFIEILTASPLIITSSSPFLR